MLTIHLHDLEFHSFHGYHQEEQLLGNVFKVSVDVNVDTIDHVSTIAQTVNYVTIYNVIRQRMQQSTTLLETLAQDLALAIRKLDERIRSVSITIKKPSPPIESFQGSVGVSYKKEF